MITPRATRLVRVADLQAFREAVATLACEGPPLAARDRLVIVPTHAAAEHAVRTIEAGAAATGRTAAVLPDFATPREIVSRFGERLTGQPPLLAEAEREVLLGVACRVARDQGVEPPFRLRPGLIAEILRFYDDLRRRQNDTDAFERRALGVLEPGAVTDRGAERLVRQTRFLVAAFREFERRIREVGDDEHGLRARVCGTPARRPYQHAVLTVADESVDPSGLCAADWDLLARVPGLSRLDVVVTDPALAGAFHERVHHLLPGIEEVRYESEESSGTPILVIPPGDALVHEARDREEEVAWCARQVKRGVRDGALSSSDQAAIVVRHRLPYVYVTREVLRSAGLQCQTFDALPLAGEPYAAALDLVLSLVSANFARGPAVALLRAPQFAFASAAEVSALDRALAEAGYLGEVEALDRLLASWRAVTPRSGRVERVLRAGDQLHQVARELAVMRSPAPVAEHLDVLLAFLARHERQPSARDPRQGRQLRARGALLSTLRSLRDAHDRFDDAPVDVDAVASLVRRWIEGQTFAPRTGTGGVHLVDADSARFGRFEYVHVAGVVDGEWPERPRRSIFYSSSVLRELGWPPEADRLSGARAAFADLLRLPTRRLSVSVFMLESDALVSASPLIDEVEHAGFDALESPVDRRRIFEYEALSLDPVDLGHLKPVAEEWAARRLRRREATGRSPGQTEPHQMPAFSLSALERYQDCPFQFFAAHVLRLEESPEDESALSPRARGRFVHEVFQHFFEAWDARGVGPVTPERVEEARALLAEVAEPLLARLPPADAALERARLFGSAIVTGSADIVLGAEVAREADVEGRWLEYRLEGEFALGATDGRRIGLKGVADRVDLLTGNRLRVIDYKSGSAPHPRRALQAPIYALCAQERLEARDGAAWTIDEAGYLVFSGKRSSVPVVKPGDRAADQALSEARARLFEAVDGVARGEFPPRPHDTRICSWCAYASVCRKDYVDG